MESRKWKIIHKMPKCTFVVKRVVNFQEVSPGEREVTGATQRNSRGKSAIHLSGASLRLHNCEPKYLNNDAYYSKSYTASGVQLVLEGRQLLADTSEVCSE